MRLNLTTAFVAMAAFALAGCNCQQMTQKNFPELEVTLPDGSPLPAEIDFGLVQVDVKATRKIRIINAGTGTLTISAGSTMAPFGFETAVPVDFAPGIPGEIELSFTPTVPDQVLRGTVTLTTNDDAHATYDIKVLGKGVTAVASVSPNPVVFGDVYINENKEVMVTVTNAGGTDLPLKGAALTGSLTGVTADLAPFSGTLPPNGGSATVALRFAPTMPGAISGALEINLDAQFGGKVTVPVSGRGTASDPRLCFKFDDTGMEACTTAIDTNLQVDFGPICDNKLFPPGSGPLGCTLMNGRRSGHFYVRNEGIVPVRYSYRVLPQVPASVRCDGGMPSAPDFTFSNAPDGGGMVTWTTPTVGVPSMESDPKPWESMPVTVNYQANSGCRTEAADQAQVFWTRQGEMVSRQPQTIVMTITGRSRLPAAKEKVTGLGTRAQPANIPSSTPLDFVGVTNIGDAPLTVTSIELYEEFPFFGPDGGQADGGGPRGGVLQRCPNPGSPGYDQGTCARYVWDTAAGGNPAMTLPTVLDAGSANNPASKVLGRLFIGCLADGGLCESRRQDPFLLYAVITTSDPYTPQLIVPIEAFVAVVQ